MKKTLLIITVLIAFSCGNKKITSDVNFEMTTEVTSTFNGFTIIDKTKLGFDAYKNGKIVAQNFDVYVESGKFEGTFGVDIIEIDSVSIDCFANNAWQNDQILNDLKYIKSKAWNDEQLTTMVNIQSAYNEIVKNVIGVSSDYQPNGSKIDEIRDVSFSNVKRFSVIVSFSKELTAEEIDKEIRYYIFEAWKENKDAKAISIKCFLNSNDIALKVGDFAPFGEWSRANENCQINDYKVNIN